MSQAKLTAAKELIQEKRYTEARALLNTVNHLTASRWLEQLDRIASQMSSSQPYSNIMIPPPPPPALQYYAPPTPSVTAEADQYYRSQNRRRNRRRISSGIEMILLGLGCFGASVYMASLPKFTIPGSPPPDNSFSLLLLGGGVICLLAGIYRIRRRD